MRNLFRFSGKDGSTEITNVQVDAAGTGKSFVAAKMLKNGVEVRPRVPSKP